jgi:endonuclease III
MTRSRQPPQWKRKRTTRTIDAPEWDLIFREISTHAPVAAYRASINVLAEKPLGSDPFEVLVATVISLRTRDEVTLPAAERLLGRGGSPAAMLLLSPDQIETLIYPAGFYRTKARTILEVSRILQEQHGGTVPSTRDALTALPGVGLKTANLVLALGFGIDAICVDTHVHRVANRMGWVHTANPDRTTTALEEILPRKYWIPINQWMVAFGRTVCTPGRPLCSRCPVQKKCGQVGVTGPR